MVLTDREGKDIPVNMIQKLSLIHIFRVLRYENMLCNTSVIQCITKKFQEIRIIFPSYEMCIRDRVNTELEGVDALVTDIPGYCLCVSTADCVPVLLYDTRKKVVAVSYTHLDVYKRQQT